MDPGGMGDVDEENSISNDTGIGLTGQGFSENLTPGPPEGVGLELVIEL